MDKSAQRQKAHETLINIAGVSKRLHTELARANANLQGVSARTRLDKIVVATKSILAKSLSNDSSLDPRLEDWLCSKEPDMCLHILNGMERVIVRDLDGKSLWGKVSNTVHSMYTEGKIHEAIKLFNDGQDFFHFLVKPEVWNCETDMRPHPRTALDVIQSRSDMLVRSHNDATITRREGRECRAPSTIVDETEGIANKGSAEGEENETADPKKLDSVLQWLNGFGCSEKHQDVVSLRQPDTCTWLFETDRYNEWRNGDNSCLWLHGKAGAGKTVLAASIIEGITTTIQDGESIVFFYCDFRDERTTSAAAVMCSILSQLLRILRGKTSRDLVDDMIHGQTEGTLVLKRAGSVVPFVSRAARQFSRQPFVVLDALDECQDVENLLHALLELTNDGMRLFVTSRPLQIIKDELHKLPSISMEKMAKEVFVDISLHVAREVDGDRRLRILDEKVKTEICTTLRDNADGMFRWVQCQIDALKKCATTRDIRTVLDSLPTSLDETYERILRAIDPQSSDGKVALRALVWLVAALRPLEAAEILEALSIDLQGRRLDREIAPVHEFALLDALGSLVVYDEETDIISLSHFTVKEYLIGELCLAELPMYYIDMQTAHAQVALLCMCYVGATINSGKLSESEIASNVLSDQPTDVVSSTLPSLLHYAFRHGFHHLRYLAPGNSSVIDGMITLRSDIEQHPTEWWRICKLTTLSLPCLLTPLAAQHDFIICVLISSLPESFLRAFLHRTPFKASDGTSPLIYATYFDKIRHARTLLSYGVSHVNGTGLDVERPCQVLPLEVAFHYQRHSLFDLFLLDQEAAVPPQLLSSVFHEQYLNYNPRDATMLLQCDEFAEWVVDGQHGQSLLRALYHDWNLIMQSASEKEAITVLRRLVQVGCDFSVPNSLESTLRVILSAASQRSLAVLLYLYSLDLPMPSRALSVGGTTLIQALVRQGLDINTIMARGDAALHRAFGKCRYGSSCWAPDCNFCSVFLRVIAPQCHVLADILLVGSKGVGKSSLVNMILGVPDNLPGAAQVINGSTSQFTSYATLLGSLPVQVWDTPGLDKALDGHSIRRKLNDWLLQISSSHLKHNLETDRPYLKVPIVQIVWCTHAGEISDPVSWQQFRAIHEECHDRPGVISMVLVNQVPTQSPGHWEVQCKDQLGRLGLSEDPGPLKSVRSHQGVSSSEYEDDSRALRRLIQQHLLQNLVDHSHEVLPLALNQGSDHSFRCVWVTTHPESICNSIVRQSDLSRHLHLCHDVEAWEMSNALVTCRWRSCNKYMHGRNLVGHIQGLHLRWSYACICCSKEYRRLDILRAHIIYSHGI